MSDGHEEVRRLFYRATPPDRVRGPGLTREALLRMNDAVDQFVTVSTSGELLEDVDGRPLGVGPTRVENGIFGGVTVTRADLDRLGLTAEEVPNVRVIDAPNQEENK